jgi:hypothetical protein
MVSAFSEHRHKDSVYTGRNFGVIEIEWGGEALSNPGDTSASKGVTGVSGVTVRLLDEQGNTFARASVDGTSRLHTPPPPLISGDVWWRPVGVIVLVMVVGVVVGLVMVRVVRRSFVRNVLKKRN